MCKDFIDLKDVLERVQDDWELLLELLEIFQEDYQDKRNQLTQVISAGDFEQIRNIAHSLKGAAGNISATEFHNGFFEMEQAATDEEMERIQQVMARLDGQFPELKKCIAKIKDDYQKSH